MRERRPMFLHDPRRVMVAASKRLLAHPGGPVRDSQLRLLAAGIEGMDTMSPELTALHETFRFALRVLDKEDDWRLSHLRTRELMEQARAVDRILGRLEAAYNL